MATELSAVPTGNDVGEGMFQPDMFSQAEALLSPNSPQADTSSTASSPIATQSSQDEVQLEREDIQALVELPFDACAIITKFDNFSLDAIDSERLSKLFLKPMQRLLGKTKNIDLMIALSSLAAIITEKSIEFAAFRREQVRARKLQVVRREEAQNNTSEPA